MPESDQNPSVKIKIFFWIILGIFSTSFGEVLAGSMPFPLFNSMGWAVTIPLYTLHILVLGTLALKVRANFYQLYLFGIIFGLYEAYITKILWSPLWESHFSLGGVAVIETLVLVLFWHPIVSFILPFTLVDKLLTNPTTIADKLPFAFSNFLNGNSSKILIFFSALYGITHTLGLNSQFGLFSALSFIISLSLLVLIWRKVTNNRYDLISVLPNTGQLKIFLVLLVLFYIITGISLRPSITPSLEGQAIIWILYVVTFILIYMESKLPYFPDEKHGWHISRRQLIIPVTIFLLFSYIAPLTGYNTVVIISTIVNWTISVIIGLILLGATLKHIFSTPQVK